MNPIYAIPTSDPRVTAAIERILAKAAEAGVPPDALTYELFDGDTSGGIWGIESHWVTFRRAGKTEPYVGSAGLIAITGGSVAWTEMQAMGLV